MRELAAYLELAAALIAGAVIYLKPELAPWPLLVAPVFWAARLALQAGERRRAVRFLAPDGWVILFQLSALVGLWATYDRALGLTIFGPGGDYKFWLIGAGAVIYFAAARLPGQRAVWLAMAGFGLFGALVAGYYLLTRDFSTETAKFPLITELGQLIQSLVPRVATITVGRQMHPNVAGGLAAMFFPALLQTVLSGWRRLSGTWLKGAVLAASITALMISAVGIALSSSRGAWIGLACALGGWFGWALLEKSFLARGVSGVQSLRKRAVLFALVGLVVLPAALLMMLWLISRPEAGAGAESSLYGRLELLQNSLLLVQAAPLTGTGLGTFPMVYSTYVLMIHVPFTSHAHNIFMNILLSQGWPGLLIFLALQLAGLRMVYRLARQSAGKWPLAGIVAMLVVSLVHGFVDDPLYGSRAVLVWLIPLGLAASAARSEDLVPAAQLPFRTGRVVGLSFAAAAVIGLIFFRNSLLAAYETNLAVVEQAKIELARYDPARFTELSLEQIRLREDYSRPMARFARVLQYKPRQLAASQHLAEFALMRGEYDNGLAYIEPLWTAGRRDRVTRILFASALVADGQPQAAAAVVNGLTWAEERLSYEAWYRYYVNQDFDRAGDAYRAVLLLDPTDDNAQRWLADIENNHP